MIDLHTHSTVSDGTDSPEQLVRLATDAGLTAIALTDHDTIDGLDTAGAAARQLGLRLVRGCELSCAVDRGALHMIVLFLEAETGPLQDRLAELRAGRDIRNGRVVTALADAGVEIHIDEVLEEAGAGAVGRPHVAAVLLRKGYVSSINEAFDRWLARGRPAYVERERLDPTEVISLAHASGAITVLAHPRSLDLTDTELSAALEKLAAAGLDGMECEYGRYTRHERTTLRELARRHELAPSGGSDYHGHYKPDLSVGVGAGDLHVPDGWLDELEARRPG